MRPDAMKAALLTILFLLPLPAAARTDSTAFRRDPAGISERASLAEAEAEHATARFYEASPAAALRRPNRSLSQLAVRMNLRREEEARLQPLGDGALEGGFYAESFRRLDDRSVVWADARYVRGNRRNVRWNSTADYLLLYPYIVADSVGGDLTTEEYAFGGGYARRIGRFDIALRGDYRAAQEYRQVDPRPHNVVSDFTVRLGAGMELGRSVLILDLRGRLYKQNSRISFFNETNTVRELFMAGLGSILQRYSGKSGSTLTAYTGRGYAVAAQLMPHRPEGWYARAEYSRFTTDRNYRPNNSIPVSTLRTQRGEAHVAYRAGRWSLGAYAARSQRLGIEMVADRTGQGTPVDRQAMYENRIWQAGAEATVEWRRGNRRYALRPGVEWQQSAAEYLWPAREMTLSRLGGSLRGHAEWLFTRWRFKASLGIGCYGAPSGTLSLPGLTDYLAEYLTGTAERLNSRTLAPEAGFRAERRLRGRTACFAEAGWSPRLYEGGLAEHNLTAACGFLF